MKRTTAMLCAALLTLTACGESGGGGGDEDEKAKKNIKDTILKDGDSVTGGAKPSEEQAGCMADGMVDEVGVEKLQEYKILDKDLKIIEEADTADMEKGDAEALASVIVDCVDMPKLIENQVSQSTQTKLTAKQKSCIGDAIDEETIEAGLAASFQGKKEDNPMQKMQGDMMKCFIPAG